MNARFLLRLFIIFVLSVGLIYLFTNTHKNNIVYQIKQKEHSSSDIGGDFTLKDQDNKYISSKDFKGKFLLVYFGYTYCPDICPMALDNISKALKTLGNLKDQVQVFFISIDEKRDTPEILKLYHQNFDQNIIMLTGNKEELAKVMKEYKVYKKEVVDEKSKDYLIDHTSLVYLMDKDAKFLEAFSHSSPPEVIQKILLKRIKQNGTISP